MDERRKINRKKNVQSMIREMLLSRHETRLMNFNSMYSFLSQTVQVELE